METLISAPHLLSVHLLSISRRVRSTRRRANVPRQRWTTFKSSHFPKVTAHHFKPFKKTRSFLSFIFFIRFAHQRHRLFTILGLAESFYIVMQSNCTALGYTVCNKYISSSILRSEDANTLLITQQRHK